jgi:hypothetical protein
MKKILKITSLFFICGMFYSSAMAGCKTIWRESYENLDVAQKRHGCTNANIKCSENRAKEHKKYDDTYDSCLKDCDKEYDQCVATGGDREKCKISQERCAA